jgi:hypothetical protein
VDGPDSVNEGTSFFFTANLTGGNEAAKPIYNWTISSGKILRGQGTTTIEADTAGLGSETITASVQVGGFPRMCPTSASASTYVVQRPKARKIDEYGPSTKSDLNNHLDNFAIELQNDPTAQGYTIAYGGRHSVPGTGQKTADAAKRYLVDVRGIESDRIVTKDGGYKDEVMTELWVVPSGATPPTASPRVDPSEIKKPKPKATTRRTKKSG